MLLKRLVWWILSFSIGISSSEPFRCSTHRSGMTCEGSSDEPCYWHGTDHPEGELYAMGCRFHLSNPNLYEICRETIRENVTSSCVDKDKEKLCCCVSEKCNGVWEKRQTFTFINKSSFMKMTFAFAGIGMYSVIGMYLSSLSARNSLSPLQPKLSGKIYRGVLVVLSVKLFLGFVLLCAFVIPLKRKCSPHKSGIFHTPIHFFFEESDHLLVCALTCLPLFYLTLLSIQTRVVMKNSVFPCHGASYVCVLLLTHVLWVGAAFGGCKIADVVFRIGEYCEYLHVRILWKILMCYNVVVCCFDLLTSLILYCLFNIEKKKCAEENFDTSSVSTFQTTQSEVMITARTPTPVLIKSSLRIEPRPFIMSSSGEATLSIWNMHVNQWIALRLIVSAPAHYMISPQRTVIPPGRECTFDLKMSRHNRIVCREHALMIEWFVIGTEYPNRDAQSLWTRPLLKPRSQWKHFIMPVYHEPKADSQSIETNSNEITCTQLYKPAQFKNYN